MVHEHLPHLGAELLGQLAGGILGVLAWQGDDDNDDERATGPATTAPGTTERAVEEPSGSFIVRRTTEAGIELRIQRSEWADMPGFVPAGFSVGWVSLLLGAIFVLLTIGYFALLLAASGPITRLLTTGRIRRRIERVTGLVLIGFGLRLGLES